MKKRHLRYLLLSLLLLACLVALFSITRNNRPAKNVFYTTTSKQEIPDKKDGVVSVLPREEYVLKDNESRIRFGSGGSATAVPSIIFGENYTLNDIHDINYLPLRKEITFYNNGYTFTLRNIGCETEDRFTDVQETWVTKCDIEVKSSETETPFRRVRPSTTKINTNTFFKRNIASNLDEVLIYAMIPNLTLQKWEMREPEDSVGLQTYAMTSYSTKTPFDITFVTGFGIDTIRYTANELWNKESKSLKIGALEITSNIKNYTCRVVYSNKVGQETKRCEDVTVELVVTGENSQKYPVSIIDYYE